MPDATADPRKQPFPLTAFEECMLHEDSAASPCWVRIRLAFSGPFDASAFDQAIAAVLPEHPLFSATVVQKRGRLYWQWSEHPAATVTWMRSRNEHHLPDYRDLRLEPGLHLFGYANGTQTEIFVEVHHACSDGIGITTFLEDVLVVYDAGRALTSAPPLRQFVRKTFLRRGRFHRAWWNALFRFFKQRNGWIGVRRFLKRRPVPILARSAPAQITVDASTRMTHPDDCQNAKPTSHRFHRSLLSIEQSNSLLDLARQGGGTLNNMLIAIFCDSLGKLRRKHVQHDSTHNWLRLMVPMNMRLAVDAKLPAANIVSVVFFDCQILELEDRQALLNRAHSQMNLIKDRMLSFIFIYSLEVFRCLPGGLKKASQQQKGAISSVFSNLGVVFQNLVSGNTNDKIEVGPSVLEQFDLWPPLPQGNHLAVAVATYGRRLGLSIRYDENHISPQVLHDLETAFIESVNEFQSLNIAISPTP